MSAQPVANSIAGSLFGRAPGLARSIGQSPFTPNSWVARIGSFVTIILLALALTALQLSFLGKALLFQLPSYGLIGVATLIACFTLTWKSAMNRACFYSALGFGGYVCIRALASPSPYFARADLYCALAALGTYLLIATALVSSSRRLALLVLLLAFGVYHVLVGLVQFGVGQNFLGVPFLAKFELTRRASGFYRNPDHLAGLLDVLGIFALSITCWA